MVDSEDIPLNLSRELLQDSALIRFVPANTFADIPAEEAILGQVFLEVIYIEILKWLIYCDSLMSMCSGLLRRSNLCFVKQDTVDCFLLSFEFTFY